MNRSDQDAANVVQAWLQDGSSNLSERVRASVMGSLPTTRQAPPPRLSRRSMLGRPWPAIAVAAAAVTIVAVVGVSMHPRGGGVGGGTATATPVPTPAATPRPFATPWPVEDWEPLEPGLHVITEARPLTLALNVPASGWLGGPWGSGGWSAAKDGFGGIGFTTTGWAPCLDDPALDRSPTSVDGFVGELFEIRVNSACIPPRVMDEFGMGPGRGPDMFVDVWVLDVDGVRLVMHAVTGSGNAAMDAAVEEYLRQLVVSVQIEAR